MNYGKYFRLNQRISIIEKGIAVYDYIDLPAYFDSGDISRNMSPKYPISVAITENSVRFIVHYGTYKCGDEYFDSIENEETMSEAIEDIKIRHIEEVILELPFNSDSTDDLSKRLKNIYCTKYPLNKNFIQNLIDKRYYGTKSKDIETELYDNMRANNDGDASYSSLWLMGVHKNKNAEGKFFLKGEIDNKAEGASIKTFSPTALFDCMYQKFDSIWKDIKKEEKQEQKENEPTIIGFLRKLLLDFMFDLKHSDVFQTSKYYQSMYSGLMNNFFFSALMHKCEYYYQRGLVNDLIGRKKSEGVSEEDKKKIIRGLYAEKLYEDEEAWVNDIMSSEAERHFLYYSKNDPSTIATESLLKIVLRMLWWWLVCLLCIVYTCFYVVGGFLYFLYELISWVCNPLDYKDRKIFRPHEFKIRDSWFTSPEEEMRRVCFITLDKDNGIHACNMENVLEYINDNPTATVEELSYRQHQRRTAISQWFLKRYDVADVMHMHLFKDANYFMLIPVLILFGCLFVIPNFLVKESWIELPLTPIITILGVLILVLFGWLFYKFSNEKTEIDKDKDTELDKDKDKVDGGSIKLSKQRHIMVSKRMLSILLTITVILAVLIYGDKVIPNSLIESSKNVGPNGTLAKFGVIAIKVFAIYIVILFIRRFVYSTKWILNMHVFYPRLIASITAAWLSLAVGNELYGAFFDSIVSWSTCLWLMAIVFAFVTYEINNLLPKENTIEKFFRCMHVMVISYGLSLVIGLFIINFTGERFLERSGVLEDFYEDYVYNDNNERQVENRRFKFVSESGKKIKTQEDLNVKGELKIKSASNNVSIEGKVSYDEKKGNITAAERLNGLRIVHIVSPDPESSQKKNHPIATNWELDSGGTFFILRDFLIQFSFVAMFIGIFIQMIFEEKSITEV